MSWVAIGGSVAGAVVGGVMNDAGGGNSQNLQSSSGSSNTGYSQMQPIEAAKPILGFNAGNTQNMMQRPTPFFPGQTYVGPSAGTQKGVQSIMGNALHNMSPYLQQSKQNFDFLSNAADVANNPYVQDQLNSNRQQVGQAFSEDWLPQINQGAQEVNALGSSRHGIAQAQGAERAAQQLSNTNAETMLNAYGQGLGAQTNALGMTGSMLQNQLAPGNAMIGAGKTVEDYQGRALQDAMARHQYQYQEPWQRMGNTQQTMNMLNPYGTQYSSGSSTGSQMTPNPNYMSPMQSMMGGASMGAGMGQYFGGGGNQAPIVTGS